MCSKCDTCACVCIYAYSGDITAFVIAPVALIDFCVMFRFSLPLRSPRPKPLLWQFGDLTCLVANLTHEKNGTTSDNPSVLWHTTANSQIIERDAWTSINKATINYQLVFRRPRLLHSKDHSRFSIISRKERIDRISYLFGIKKLQNAVQGKENFWGISKNAHLSEPVSCEEILFLVIVFFETIKSPTPLKKEHISWNKSKLAHFPRDQLDGETKTEGCSFNHPTYPV